ncbi:MAG: hypothetical protein WCY67_06790 [Acidithiobacillus sp.]
MKTTRGDKVPGLSEKQKAGGAAYTEERLKRAKAGRYAPRTTTAQAKEAEKWIKDAGDQNKLTYKVQGVHLQQGDDGTVTARLAPEKDWPPSGKS